MQLMTCSLPPQLWNTVIAVWNLLKPVVLPPTAARLYNSRGISILSYIPSLAFPLKHIAARERANLIRIFHMSTNSFTSSMPYELHKFSNISVRAVVPMCISTMFRTGHKTLRSYDWQYLHAALQAAAYSDNSSGFMAACASYHGFRLARWMSHAFVTNLYIAYNRFPVDMLKKRNSPYSKRAFAFFRLVKTLLQVSCPVDRWLPMWPYPWPACAKKLISYYTQCLNRWWTSLDRPF